MAEFLMPSLGADMEAGTLVQWRKQPGDHVARGEIIAEVETEKGVIEVECFCEGIVQRQLVSTGSKVPVGTPLAIIGEGSVLEPAPRREPTSEAPAAPVVAPPATPSASPASVVEPVHATPAARRLSREHELPLTTIAGSGSHGSITRTDVVRALEQPAVAVSRLAVSPLARREAERRGIKLSDVQPTGPRGSIVLSDVQRHVATAKPSESEAPRGMRHAIAQAMSRSKREIPHYYLTQLADLSAPLDWLARYNEEKQPDERALPGILLIRAVAMALHKFPELNGPYEQPPDAQAPGVHVGVAVSLRAGGLVAPAIFDADKLSFAELTQRFKDVVNRARSGALRSSEMSGATITVTSLGERGVDVVYPVIMPPQRAMVGFGTIAERALVRSGAVVARRSVYATLAADHRVSDGHRGGLFLSTLCHILEEPPS